MDGWSPKQDDKVIVTGYINRRTFKIPKADPRWNNPNYRTYMGLPREQDLVMPWKNELKDGNIYATWTKVPFYRWQGRVPCVVMGWSYKLIGEIVPASGTDLNYDQGGLIQWDRFKAWTVFEIDKYDRYHAPFVTLLEFMEKK